MEALREESRKRLERNWDSISERYGREFPEAEEFVFSDPEAEETAFSDEEESEMDEVEIEGI